MTFAANQNKITSAYVTQFHDSFEITCQQKESRLLKTIHNRGSITGNMFTINDMGNLEMRDRVRFGDTQWDLPDSGTRRVYLADKSMAVPVDKMDVPKLLASVQGPYMNACLFAYQREVDKAIYNALLGEIERINEYNGSVTKVSLPNTQVILHNNDGITKSKILTAKSIFRDNECDEHNGEEIYMLYDAIMMSQILSDTTLTSADFMSLQMLQEGKVGTKWCGINWIPYNSLKVSDDGGLHKKSVMYTGTSVHFGQGSAYDVDISKRPDKNNTHQILVDASFAAGRANEQKVVEIQIAA